MQPHMTAGWCNVDRQMSTRRRRRQDTDFNADANVDLEVDVNLYAQGRGGGPQHNVYGCGKRPNRLLVDITFFALGLQPPSLLEVDALSIPGD